MDSPARIMLVEDEDDIRSLVHTVIDLELGHIEHVIIEVSNGRDAVRVCAEQSPDVVVLDLHLPGMSGLEVLREIGVLPDPPCVVAWSADALALRRAVSFGARMALDKTDEVQGLVEAVEACLQQSAARA